MRTPLLLLYYVPGRYDMKVGFSVSKKVGKSVVRNKVKRRLKEKIGELSADIMTKVNEALLISLGFFQM